MLNQKYTIKDYFRQKNEKKLQQDSANDFNIIPSWNKEFACLVGLEEVVKFRLERLDKTEYTAPNTRKRGRQKKFPIPAVVPPAHPKDPNTCTKCNTDVSCSWKFDTNSSLLCHFCFKYSWRKDHWLFNAPRETIIKSISDNSSITSANQAVVNDPQPMKEAVFSLQPSSHSISQECDPQVPKISTSSPSNCYSDSPFSSSSSFSSDFLSSPPGYFSDTSLDHHCLGFYCASSSCVSSLSDISSPFYLSAFSDSNSSSSVSPSPGSSPPNSSTKKVRIPYYMETGLAKALLKDDTSDQKSKEKDEHSQYKEERTDALSLPSSLSNQNILIESQFVLPDSEPSTSPLLSVGEHQLQTRILTPNLQKTAVTEKRKLTLKDGLKPVGHGNLQKVTASVSTGSSTHASDSVKSKSTVCYLPKALSAVSGNVRQQDSRSISKCPQESIIGTIVKHCTSQAQKLKCQKSED